jgi:hypothetical protein
MRLYNLTSEKWALDNLRNGRIKISTIEDLNDPFELQGLQLSKKEYRVAFRRMKQQLHKNRGILCFSKSWKNPVLWSHYGDKHRGICLGFDVPDDMFTPIDYVESMKLVEFDLGNSKSQLDENLMSELLHQKYKDWGYEEEYRGWVSLDEKDKKTGLHFMEFSEKLILKEIIIGPRNNTKLKELQQIINLHTKGVEIVKARLAFKSYSVVPNKKYKRIYT